ncbi:ImcF-related family protein [Caballeronia telluris]|nr:ImcF-related family protein [Caballeronia telluris]
MFEHELVRKSRLLGWAAPAYLLDVVDVDGVIPAASDPVAITWSTRGIDSAQMRLSLESVSRRLADLSVQRLVPNINERCLAQVSRHVTHRTDALSALVMRLNNGRASRTAVFGILFAPLFSSQGADTAAKHEDSRARALATWQTVAEHSRHVRGRRVGFSPSTSVAWAVTTLAALSLIGTILSGVVNRTGIEAAANLALSATAALDPTQAAQTLDALQKHLDTLETRQHEGAPWYARFGLNHDAALLTALWPTYATASNRILTQPIRAKLEADLRQLSALTDQELASGGDAQTKRAYSTLKTYLMLANPQHTDTRFLIPALLETAQPARPDSSPVTPGGWRDLTQRLITFHANHLAQHGAALAMAPDATLVSTARQTLVSVVGLQNSTDTVYEQILDENRSKYPPVSLQTLLGDAAQEGSSGAATSRGLFMTKETLPGVYTRAAWDERIGRAIDDADEQRSVAGDWVLSDASTVTSATSAASLKDALRQRYFADYARNWQQFLNSVRWQPDTSLSGTVDQLNLYADPQRSPLSALFKMIVYQANAGATGRSLSDTLVSKARDLLKGGEKDDPSKAPPPPPEAPLAGAFGPLLRLTGSDPSKASTAQDLSLPRYLERVTAVRLKLQQIMTSPDPDAMSRTAAQAILQGKTSDLGDSRDYASRVAASLGEQWAGLGDALFQRPLDQTWDVVLKPASASLNETWRASVVAAWNRSFGGRYPFADSDNDASLPEMARFLRADSGVIAQFVATQLAGILERQGDQWVVAQGATRNTLAVDPEFVRALNRLTRVSHVLFPNGDAGVRYELRAVSTPGITDMKFKLSGRELHYFNQKEEWTPFIWPGDALENNAHVEWQTENAGVRSDLDFAGRFGLIRLLERAVVTQQDGARYVLRWTPGASSVVQEERAKARQPASAPAAPPHPRNVKDDWSADAAATIVSVAEANPASSSRATSRDETPPRAPQKPLALQVQLRSEAGAGPLDALQLRHFTLPSRIFLSGAVAKGAPGQGPNPPPLPPAAIEAAKHAAMPLPRNAAPEFE